MLTFIFVAASLYALWLFAQSLRELSRFMYVRTQGLKTRGEVDKLLKRGSRGLFLMSVKFVDNGGIEHSFSQWINNKYKPGDTVGVIYIESTGKAIAEDYMSVFLASLRLAWSLVIFYFVFEAFNVNHGFSLVEKVSALC